MHQGLFLHSMRSTANSQCNGDRIGMICHRANQMSHHLTRELVPLDAWSITQNGWEPGEKETNMVASFSGVTEGVPILGRVLQYLLHIFSRGGQELLKRSGPFFFYFISFAAASFLFRAGLLRPFSQVMLLVLGAYGGSLFGLPLRE